MVSWISELYFFILFHFAQNSSDRKYSSNRPSAIVRTTNQRDTNSKTKLSFINNYIVSFSANPFEYNGRSRIKWNWTNSKEGWGQVNQSVLNPSKIPVCCPWPSVKIKVITIACLFNIHKYCNYCPNKQKNDNALLSLCIPLNFAGLIKSLAVFLLHFITFLRVGLPA